MARWRFDHRRMVEGMLLSSNLLSIGRGAEFAAGNNSSGNARVEPLSDGERGYRQDRSPIAGRPRHGDGGGTAVRPYSAGPIRWFESGARFVSKVGMVTVDAEFRQWSRTRAPEFAAVSRRQLGGPSGGPIVEPNL